MLLANHRVAKKLLANLRAALMLLANPEAVYLHQFKDKLKNPEEVTLDRYSMLNNTNVNINVLANPRAEGIPANPRAGGITFVSPGTGG